MKLGEWIDRTKLAEYTAGGLISAREHPTLPLVILNYTPAAQSVKVWDVTLSRCRGLVYEKGTEEIYAIPFSKFWNYNDPAHPETLLENLPKMLPQLYEKVDGSLGIGFFYNGEFIISTRGSFESEQAKWAQAWINERKNQIVGPFDSHICYLFEIVYPKDRKVVKYLDSGLVLLGAIDRTSGIEYNPENSRDRFRWVRGFRSAHREHTSLDLDKLQQLDNPDEEGYVAVWYGDPTFRVKIKFETYKRLHRLYFQTTTDVIWELTKEGKNLGEYLEGADMDLRMWAAGKQSVISALHTVLARRSKDEFREAMWYTNSLYDLDASEHDRRKAFAFKATESKNPDLLFLLYDGKLDRYDEALWKKVRPENARFTKVEDGA